MLFFCFCVFYFLLFESAYDLIRSILLFASWLLYGISVDDLIQLPDEPADGRHTWTLVFLLLFSSKYSLWLTREHLRYPGFDSVLFSLWFFDNMSFGFLLDFRLLLCLICFSLFPTFVHFAVRREKKVVHAVCGQHSVTDDSCGSLFAHFSVVFDVHVRVCVALSCCLLCICFFFSDYFMYRIDFTSRYNFRFLIIIPFHTFYQFFVHSFSNPKHTSPFNWRNCVQWNSTQFLMHQPYYINKFRSTRFRFDFIMILFFGSFVAFLFWPHIFPWLIFLWTNYIRSVFFVFLLYWF